MLAISFMAVDKSQAGVLYSLVGYMITWKEGEMRDMVNHSTRIAISQEHNLRVWGQQVR